MLNLRLTVNQKFLLIQVKVVTPEGFGASFTDQKIRARFVKKGNLTKASTMFHLCTYYLMLAESTLQYMLSERKVYKKDFRVNSYNLHLKDSY